ncbi:UNVERIFIED_CONTAM: hypothetical protein GTU68_029200 [Idotea baltica]|nr:hypothetical protein [Idotea baltica]
MLASPIGKAPASPFWKTNWGKKGLMEICSSARRKTWLK